MLVRVLGGCGSELNFSLRYIHHKEEERGGGRLWPSFISVRLGARNPRESEKMCQSLQSARETAAAAQLGKP